MFNELMNLIQKSSFSLQSKSRPSISPIGNEQQRLNFKRRKTTGEEQMAKAVKKKTEGKLSVQRLVSVRSGKV